MAPFASAYLKLHRAEDQTSKLAEEVSAFLDIKNEAQGFQTYPHPNQREWTMVYRLFKPFPDLWPVQIGEIVHNLRSALDHVIFEASASDGRQNPIRGTEFPIFLDKAKFFRPVSDRSGGQYKIRGILDERARTLITRFQPFEFSNPPLHYLWILHELSNTDKHRLLNVATTYDMAMNIAWNPGQTLRPDEIEEYRPTGGNWPDGGEVLYIRTSIPLPDAQLSVDAGVVSQIMFDDAPPAANLPVFDTISKIGRLVGGMVNEMRRLAEPS